MLTRVDRHPADGRFVTRGAGIDSRHSFSFGSGYDPANTHFGLLLAHNEDRLAAGSGYGTHRHRDMEIVTWVLSGTLLHRDEHGAEQELGPGQAHRISAGRGFTHAEYAGPDPVHVVQMWVVTDEHGGEPGYDRADLGGALAAGGLVPVAAGDRCPDAPLRLRQRAAVLYAARLPAGRTVHLPAAAYLHVFLARGGLAVPGTNPLAAGDAVRISGGEGTPVVATAAAELLVWAMHAGLAVAGGEPA